MEDLGFKDISIKTLKLPGDFEKRLESERIRDLAVSISKHSLLHHPVVRKSDMQLISGADRTAALVFQGHTKMKVRLVECDDQEVVEIRTVENARRRHNPEKQAKDIADLVKLYSERAKAKREANPGKRKPGRPKKNETVAREEAAKKLGTTPEAIRKQEKRAKERGAEKPKVEEEAPYETKQFTFGLSIPEAYLQRADKAAELLAGVAQRMSAAQALLTELESLGPETFPTGTYQTVRNMIHDAGSIARRNAPVCVCPWCKQIPLAKQSCAACGGTGFVGRIKMENIPPELQDTENLQVAFQGSYRPFLEIAQLSDVHFAPDDSTPVSAEDEANDTEPPEAEPETEQELLPPWSR